MTQNTPDHIDTQQTPPSEHAAQTPDISTKTDLGRLTLLEERPVVHKERLDVGKVTVTKQVRTRTIEVPIELVEEYLTVHTEYKDTDSQALLSDAYDKQDVVRHIEPSLTSKPVITINGQAVEIGETPIEIVLSRQVATITKETHAVQEVDISKHTHIHADTLSIELQHETLEVIEEGFLDHQSVTTRE